MENIKIVLWNHNIYVSNELFSWKYNEKELTNILKNALDELDIEHDNEIIKLQKEYTELLLRRADDLRKYEEKIKQKDNQIEILKEKNRKKCILF